MSAEATTRVESACNDLVANGEAVSFTAVAKRAGLAKATLYRKPELRAIVEQHRLNDREAHSLTGIVTELGTLRKGLESLAAKVREHDEQLRASRRRSSGMR